MGSWQERMSREGGDRIARIVRRRKKAEKMPGQWLTPVHHPVDSPRRFLIESRRPIGSIRSFTTRIILGAE